MSQGGLVFHLCLEQGCVECRDLQSPIVIVGFVSDQPHGNGGALQEFVNFLGV